MGELLKKFQKFFTGNLNKRDINNVLTTSHLHRTIYNPLWNNKLENWTQKKR